MATKKIAKKVTVTPDSDSDLDAAGSLVDIDVTVSDTSVVLMGSLAAQGRKHSALESDHGLLGQAMVSQFSALSSRLSDLEGQVSTMGLSTSVQSRARDAQGSAAEDRMASLAMAVQSCLSIGGRADLVIGSAMGDDMEMAGTTPVDVTAADLNAAAATDLTLEVSISLQTALGLIHTWSRMEPVITPGESVADADVGVPVVTWTDDLAETPRFAQGYLNLTVEFDTDAGATKTYAPGDSVSVTVDISGAPMCANVSNFVLTFDVI